ncbi:MAG TPA: hypothetical protein DCO77_06390 [Nitrospiraceae bacterium]|nr:hypothetical protein [Nitrospiraceae bacterium]
MMLLRKILTGTLVLFTALGIVTVMPANKAEAKKKPTISKMCLNCHKPAPGSLRGKFDSVAFKSRSIQLKINKSTEIVKFNPETIQVVVAGKTEKAEALRKLKKGKEIRVEYSKKGGVKTASLVSVKPKIKVAAEKLLTTAEIEKLVAKGPKKGKYLLVDARPGPRFKEGALPTAINIPYPAFDKKKGMLPKDKSALIIYYCGGVT